jgi:hypothetical protein
MRQVRAAQLDLDLASAKNEDSIAQMGEVLIFRTANDHGRALLRCDRESLEEKLPSPYIHALSGLV